MLKIWPIATPDDLTPRPLIHNPFDQVASANTLASACHHPLLTPTKTVPDSSSPFSPQTTQLSTTVTTQLSLHAPDFHDKTAAMSLSIPPTKRKNRSHSDHSPIGQIHVKLIQARALNVSLSQARPYVVVQFENNEFVGRDPITEGQPQARGLPSVVRPGISRQNSAALTTLSAIGEKDNAARKSRGGSGSSPTNITLGSIPQNPVWKHEVSFDTTSSTPTSPSPPLTFNLYDRSVEESYDSDTPSPTVQPTNCGHLGFVQASISLIDGAVVDQWYPLQPPGSGEMRIQISFEANKTKQSLHPSDFEFLKLVGRGTFGKVFQVRKLDTRRIYAMKVLSKKEIILRKEVAHTIGERRILQASTGCNFLVGLKFSFQTERDLYLVTDFKSGGELFWHLQRETRFGEERARFYIAELILALEHLHKFGIVYRDLKPENILLDATGHIALCDFGLSKADLPAGELTTTFCGTTEYLAPEILLDEQGYSRTVDWWSLGVLLFEMCCGWSPFYAEETQQMYKNICFGKIRFPKGVICEDGKLFVKGLLNRNPNKRLGANYDAPELKEHPFFKSIDWEALALKQVNPPFKPTVESDESTANFDPEFTEADISELIDLDAVNGNEEEWLDEADPSEEWVSQSSTGSMVGCLTMTPGHVANGPLGSDKRKGSASSGLGLTRSKSRESAKSAKKSKKEEKEREGIQINGKKPNGSRAKSQGQTADSVLSTSMQDKFKGFSFSGGESVSGNVLGERVAKDLEGDGKPNSSGDESDDFDDLGQSAGRYAHARKKGLGFTELDD